MIICNDSLYACLARLLLQAVTLALQQVLQDSGQYMCALHSFSLPGPQLKKFALEVRVDKDDFLHVYLSRFLHQAVAVALLQVLLDGRHSRYRTKRYNTKQKTSLVCFPQIQSTGSLACRSVIHCQQCSL